ncbi:hypothetical protein [Dyella caseinilytica]|uniref:Uncharacterized protein n=1 Tax=Dyella caseinilytica TaxID=1849581 RepID=A0ABX7GZ27_9GAMM|nr:hypothetical protein [Dyella caseinilytica]QRN55652.1 hypothetical protein ISN74_10180 [Dyella caseinilytica]
MILLESNTDQPPRQFALNSNGRNVPKIMERLRHDDHHRGIDDLSRSHLFGWPASLNGFASGQRLHVGQPPLDLVHDGALQTTATAMASI